LSKANPVGSTGVAFCNEEKTFMKKFKYMMMPVAKKIPHIHNYFGKDYHDDYHWLKDQDPKEKRPEILEYIKSENSYCSNYMSPLKDLSSKIYDEILSRINEEDQEVPVFKAPYYYYSRTVKGLQYPINCRKKDSLTSSEEILLNRNDLTHEYMSLGMLRVSPGITSIY
jgi:oligopeptidase B